MIKGGLGEMALQIFYDLKKFGEVGPLIAQIDKRNKTKGEVTEFNTQETTKRMMVSQVINIYIYIYRYIYIYI